MFVTTGTYIGYLYRKHIRKFENVQDFNHDQFFFNKIKVIIIYTMISFYSFYLRRNFKKSSWIGNLFKTFFLLTYYQLLAFFFGTNFIVYQCFYLINQIKNVHKMNLKIDRLLFTYTVPICIEILVYTFLRIIQHKFDIFI